MYPLGNAPDGFFRPIPITNSYMLHMVDMILIPIIISRLLKKSSEHVVYAHLRVKLQNIRSKYG